jgi:hypothetical protein
MTGPRALGMAFGDRWRHDLENGLWRCGDVSISLDADDPTRFHVREIFGGAAFGDGRKLFGGSVPASGYSLDEFAHFCALLDHAAEEPVPTDGLAPWFELAQAQADEAYAERDAELARQRERWESERVGRTAAQLLDEVPEETAWVVPGLLVPGWATKIAGREKVGKGTLIFSVLGCVERGEDTVFGPTSRRATALILTEEPMESVREKVQAFGLREARIVYGWELATLPWPDKVAKVVEEAQADGHQIVFVDNVSRSSGVEDEAGVELARAVEVLMDSCRRAGLLLIIDHHHKKGAAKTEDKSRGGTALAGAMDINVEIERVGTGRARKLTSRGRLVATNWTRTVELSEDGTSYSDAAAGSGGEDVAEETQQAWTDLQSLRDQGPLTVRGFAGLIGKTEPTARRRLNALVHLGHAEVEIGQLGRGGKEPSLYRAKPSIAAAP